jgi:hypothetical protein
MNVSRKHARSANTATARHVSAADAASPEESGDDETGAEGIWWDETLGEVFFYCAVTDASVKKLIQTLRLATAAERAAVNGRDRGEAPRWTGLRINSGGGDLWAGFAAYTVLHQMPTLYVTIDSLCASAATLLALAVEPQYRYASPLGVVLIHEFREDMEGTINYSMLRDKSISNTKLQAIFRDVYLRRTNIDVAALDTMMAHEAMLTIDDIVGCGFAQRLEMA